MLFKLEEIDDYYKKIDHTFNYREYIKRLPIHILLY